MSVLDKLRFLGLQDRLGKILPLQYQKADGDKVADIGALAEGNERQKIRGLSVGWEQPLEGDNLSTGTRDASQIVVERHMKLERLLLGSIENRA